MNRKTTELYTMLVDFLGHALGPNYEVILQDVRKRCIVSIANGTISGRNVGAPLTDFVLKILAERSYVGQDFRYSYIGVASGDKTMRCATYFIKEDDGRLSGTLSVNCDISKFKDFADAVMAFAGLDPYQDVNNLYHKPEPPDIKHPVESFPDSVSELTNIALRKALAELPALSAKPTQEEKMNVVDNLNQKGVFLLKGAVSQAAEFLQCSEASIYRYLSKLNRSSSY